MPIFAVPLLPLRYLEYAIPSLKRLRVQAEKQLGYVAYTGLVKVLKQPENRINNGAFFSASEEFVSLCIYEVEGNVGDMILSLPTFNISAFKAFDKRVHFTLSEGNLTTIIVDRWNNPVYFFSHQPFSYGFRHIPSVFRVVRSKVDADANGCIYYLVCCFLAALFVTLLFYIRSISSNNTLTQFCESYIMFIMNWFLNPIGFFLFWFVPIILFKLADTFYSTYHMQYIHWIEKHCKVERPTYSEPRHESI